MPRVIPRLLLENVAQTSCLPRSGALPHVTEGLLSRDLSLFLIFFISMLLFVSCSPNATPPHEPAQASAAVIFPTPQLPFAPKSYVCYRIAAPLVLDGKLDDEAWQRAAWTEDFVDIEGELKPQPRYRTRAKMLWDEKNFYIAAELEEPDVWATLTKRDAIIFYDNDFEMHYPEMWGFVQFSEKEVGNEENAVRVPTHEQAKWALRQLYYRQRTHFNQHGKFAENFAALGLQEMRTRGYRRPPETKTTRNMFETQLPSADGKEVWRINHEGLVWEGSELLPER